MRWLGRERPVSGPDDVASLARVFLKLDPWSFWTVELEPGTGASFAVLGTTGAFVAVACGLEGYLVPEGGKLLVDGAPVTGIRSAKAAARWLDGRLTATGAPRAPVVPLVVLTRAMAGAPRDHRGARVVRPDDIVAEVTKRERVLDPSTAARLAGQLGRVLRGPTATPDEP